MLRIFLFFFIFLGCSCWQKTDQESASSSKGRSLNSQDETKKITVVATTGMIADLVTAIGGDRVQCRALMGPGVDPHLYKPSASDATALQNADIIFYNGLHLEGRMGELFDRLSAQGKPVYSLGGSLHKLHPNRLLGGESNDGYPDPHIWGDVSLWVLTVPLIKDALIEADQNNEKLYTLLAGSVEATLNALHKEMLQKSKQVPAARRFLITSHDAFAYFGEAYRFRVVGVQGISTVSEAGLADISATVDLIKKESIPAIFVESSVSPDVIERISEDSGATIGGELFSDAMGTLGQTVLIDGVSEDVGTYEGMIRHNMDQVVKALAGEPLTGR